MFLLFLSNTFAHRQRQITSSLFAGFLLMTEITLTSSKNKRDDDVHESAGVRTKVKKYSKMVGEFS